MTRLSPPRNEKSTCIGTELLTGLESVTPIDLDEFDHLTVSPWRSPPKESPSTNSLRPRAPETTDPEAGALLAPLEKVFGPHVKDVAVAADGNLALFNTMNWGDNLYALDLESGKVRWQRRIGQHFAFGPEAFGRDFAVQGFDFASAEGYHLYVLDVLGRAKRRFALYGLPKRAVFWSIGFKLLDRINHFTSAADGSWVAAAGDLGLAVWDREGKLLWSQDWWKTTRQRVALIAPNVDSLIVLKGINASAYRIADGQLLWEIALAKTGTLIEGAASGDGRTLAIRADSDGGKVFIVRDGKWINTLVTPAVALAWAPDGNNLCGPVTTGHQLKWYEATGGLKWTFTGDDVLRNPRVSLWPGRAGCGRRCWQLVLGATCGQTSARLNTLSMQSPGCSTCLLAACIMRLTTFR